jgi:hypothetical protein
MGTASSSAPYFGNAATIGIYTLYKNTFHKQEDGSRMAVLSLSLSLSLSKGSRVPHQAGWGKTLMKQIVKT